MDYTRIDHIFGNYVNEDIFRYEIRKRFFEEITRDITGFKIEPFKRRYCFKHLDFVKFLKDECKKVNNVIPSYLQHAIYNLFKYDISGIFGEDGEGVYLIDYFCRNAEMFKDVNKKVVDNIVDKLSIERRKLIVTDKEHPLHYLAPEIILYDPDIGSDYEFLEYVFCGGFEVSFNITNLYMPAQVLCSFGGLTVSIHNTINKLIVNKDLISDELLKEKFLAFFDYIVL